LINQVLIFDKVEILEYLVVFPVKVWTGLVTHS